MVKRVALIYWSSIVCFLLLLLGGRGEAATERKQLGIYVQNLTPRIARLNDLPSEKGVMVIGVIRGSPAEQSGIQRGDILLRYNGESITDVAQLQAFVAQTQPGAVVTLSLLRNGKLHRIRTTVEEAEAVEVPPSRVPVDDRFLRVLLFVAVLLLILVGIINHLLPILSRHLADGTLLSSLGSWRQWIGWGISLGVTLLLLWSALVIIPPGYRGVVFNLFFGMQPTVLSEGVHLVFPLLDRVTRYDVRSRTYTVRSVVERRGEEEKFYGLWMPTRDGMKIGLDITVRYRLDPDRLVELHQTVGSAFDTKIVHPAVRNIVRLVVAKFSASDLYGPSRWAVQGEIEDRLKEALIRHGIICEAFFLRSLSFPQDFERSLQHKMIAAQKIHELDFAVVQAEKRSAARQVEAQGEAQALEIINKSLQDRPHLLRYLWIKRLPPSVKVMVIPPSKQKPFWQRKKRSRSPR
ncbi:MAG: PDZ domain-containing protein [Nitrospinota bacterium]|nr:MAG: PDZ domain-containing protein [Nitrospinota bacterium]